MLKLAILGAGMIGRAIALDLAHHFEVTSFDFNMDNLSQLNALNPNIKIISCNLSQYHQYPELLSAFDIVITAVPGYMGYSTLEAVILSGKNVVDISFFPEDALELNQLAKEKHVTAIVDCGVAPGMSNLILGYLDKKMEVKEFTCLVGGLPRIRTKPFEYKAPFSPIDVIEEYTRPARIQVNGKIVTRPALSEPELVEFPRVGTLESFNTDGLRTLLHTMNHIPDMKEKTLRYPGHVQLMSSLIQAGFFNRDTIKINGNNISPLDFSTTLLFKQWKLGTREEEFTVMRITASGLNNGEDETVIYQLYDEFDKDTQTSSMARTTGYTCTAVVNLLANGLFTKKGVFPPELIGRDEQCFEFIWNYLEERNVIYTRTVE